MAIGQTLKIKGPIPKLAWLANQFSEVGMVAGGSGMYVPPSLIPFIVLLIVICLCSTPIFQVLQHSLAQKDETTKFKLIFGNVTPADILIRDELDAMAAASNGRFEVCVCVIRCPHVLTSSAL